jgi:hypothetical protein
MRPLSCEVPTLPSSSGCTVTTLVPVLGSPSRSAVVFWVRRHDATSCSGSTVATLLPLLARRHDAAVVFWAHQQHKNCYIFLTLYSNFYAAGEPASPPRRGQWKTEPTGECACAPRMPLVSCKATCMVTNSNDVPILSALQTLSNSSDYNRLSGF